ncbi:MAG: S8 family serine peptidase [Verrucomicrobiota bacterium]
MSEPNLPWISPSQASTALKKGTGKGIKIAILDSGIDTSHPVLENVSIADRFAVIETDLGVEIEEDKGGDAFGHGTAIAHLIHQVAPEAQLGSFKVLQVTEGQTAGKAAYLQTAVQAAIERGYQIVNCSFGTPARPSIFRYFKTWIDKAYLENVHVVTACNNTNYTRAEWPSHFPSVIAVNMGRIDGDDFHYRQGQMVEFFARGEKVPVPWLDGGWKTVTGSSYAAPRMSGLIARLLSQYPDLSAPLVKAVLRNTAKPWNPDVAGSNVWL